MIKGRKGTPEIGNPFSDKHVICVGIYMQV